MTRIVAVRGCGEAAGAGQMLASVVKGLGAVDLDYPAEIRPIGTRTLAESVIIGRAGLRAIDALGQSWVAVGFSLGAYVLTEHVRIDKPRHLKGVVLLGNPLRPRRHVTNGGVPTDRYGIAGEVAITGVQVKNFAIPDDPITSCPVDNGGRAIADVVTGRDQPTPARWWDAGYTLEWLWKYVGTGSRHTRYGSELMPGSALTYTQAARAALVAML